MSNELPSNDPQTIWQNQSTEVITMSSMYFREKAEQRRSSARWMAIANDVTYVALLVLLGFQFKNITNTTSRVGFALLAAGSAYVSYRRHQQLWPVDPAPVALPVTGLEAYRRELERSRDNSLIIWPNLAPLIPGCILVTLPVMRPMIGTVAANPAILINALPFLVLLGVWFVLIFPVRKRRLSNIQREIDLLKTLS